MCMWSQIDTNGHIHSSLQVCVFMGSSEYELCIFVCIMLFSSETNNRTDTNRDDLCFGKN